MRWTPASSAKSCCCRPRMSATLAAENRDVPGSRVDSSTSSNMAAMAFIPRRHIGYAHSTHSIGLAPFAALTRSAGTGKSPALAISWTSLRTDSGAYARQYRSKPRPMRLRGLRTGRIKWRDSWRFPFRQCQHRSDRDRRNRAQSPPSHLTREPCDTPWLTFQPAPPECRPYARLQPRDVSRRPTALGRYVKLYIGVARRLKPGHCVQNWQKR